MRLIKYLLIFGAITFGFAYVNANKSRNIQYRAPANFDREANYFPAYFPTTYHYTGGEKITVMIPPEFKSTLGVPKNKNGELERDFIIGKQNFNQQFGINDWVMDSYRFSNSSYGERLEINGSYTNMAGGKTAFIEHHYFGKALAQSIHVFYPANAKSKAIEQVKASLQTFNPNIN